ncbi:hypothetical protein ICV32_00720 [Polynucleobacter sp. MWH-UH24A]|uniref:hypothetical protein n=1 Tax=Polynucleobacter sp. MWH-UH24A TaxID=2689110 RepID=UPI001BFD83E6|nr:hypothetical protein [Polynucleobacter sp. MWH-UH24A]QWD76236.1 hypothetical protein ICV32_00720 [Polynucleobacter sp. MWH-UH24A]
MAYLLLGSLMGWAAAHYFPGFSPRNKGAKRARRSKATYLWSMFFGILGAVFASYGGQAAGLFTAGQMLEWGSAIVWGFLLPQVYLLSVRA